MSHTARSEIRTIIPGCVFLIALVCYGTFQVCGAFLHRHNNDFKHIFVGAEILRYGGNPYDDETFWMAAHGNGFVYMNPYVYLPFTGLVLVPLTFLGFNTASATWFILNHLFLWLSVYLLFKALNLRFDLFNIAIAVLLVGCLAPLYRTLTAGQLNCALLLLYSLILYLYKERRIVLMGLVAAFALHFRITPGILLLFFLWRRDFKTFLWTMIFTVGWGIAGLLCAGYETHRAFLPVLQDMSYGKSTWSDYEMTFHIDPTNQSFNSLFHHLFTENKYTTPVVNLGAGFANGITMVTSLVLLVVVLALTLKRKSTASGTASLFGIRDMLDYSLFIFLSLFIPSLCWDHYLVLLILPALVVLQYLYDKMNPAVLVLVILGWIAIAIPVSFQILPVTSIFAPFFMSYKLLGALLIFAACIVARASCPVNHS